MEKKPWQEDEFKGNITVLVIFLAVIYAVIFIAYLVGLQF